MNTAGPTPPRILIPSLLEKVLRKNCIPRELLQRASSETGREELPFMREILYGVLRNLLYIDWRLNPFLRRPGRLSPYTLNNLRAGAYQILFMRVPEWAAVNESVEAEKARGRHPKLVNAVLRRLIREGSQPPLPSSLERRLSILYSHPVWLVKRWLRKFGPEETEKLLQFNNTIPPLTLRINSLRITREDFRKILNDRGIPHRKTSHSPVGIILEKPEDLLRISDLGGLFYIQDEAAQLISLLLDPSPGERILDACAAPGGKATHLAELTLEKADIVAADIRPERLRILRENLSRLDIRSVRPLAIDVSELGPEHSYDRILLDAPCSSLGVIRKNPDVRYRYNRKKLLKTAKTELEILQAVSKRLQPGGRILYAVCSIEPEEGEELIRKFLNKNPDFYIIDMAELSRTESRNFLAPFRTEKGFFLSLPHRHGMDGFFGALMERKAGR